MHAFFLVVIAGWCARAELNLVGYVLCFLLLDAPSFF